MSILSSGPVVVGAAEELDQAALLSVANGRAIEITAALRSTLAARRAAALEALADGRAVYGVNTGMGAQSGVRLSASEQTTHQRNLLIARAVGGPPWLDRIEARAVLAVRLRTFLSGDAAVSVPLLDQLTRFLDADLVPAIPRAGFGSAGEIISGAHAFGPLVGLGAVLDADATAIDAPAALAMAGVAPVELGPKDGVALLQGVPGTTALALLVRADVDRLSARFGAVAALGVVAAGAALDPFTAALARGDDELALALAQLRGYLAGSPAQARSLQAPVSFRITGAVVAHLRRVNGALEAAIDRALDGVTDSPAFVEGNFVGTVGFHGLDLAAALDAVSVALVHAAESSAARAHRLLDARVTGLPAQLANVPGVDTGLVAVHKRAVGVVHQLRRTALSSVVGSIETSFGQEDVQTFSWEAATNARTAVAGLVEVLSCELLVAYQALRLSGRPAGPALQALLEAVAEVVAPIVGDRLFGADVEALRRLLTDDVARRAL